MIRLILSLVLAIIVAVFALENNRPFAIKFLFWTFPRLSEALVIIGSVLFGVILGAILSWRERVRRARQTTTREMQASAVTESSDSNPTENTDS